MLRHALLLSCAALCVHGATVPAQEPAPAEASPNPAANVEFLIDEPTLRAHVKFLSSDLLEGRGVGTRGDELARLYLATQLESSGLRPGGAEKSWFQPV